MCLNIYYHGKFDCNCIHGMYMSRDFTELIPVEQGIKCIFNYVFSFS